MRTLMWFRTDLRTADNPALFEAARRADRGVLAVFTACPRQWAQHDTAPVKVQFVLRNLRELGASLARKNIALRVLHTPTFEGVPEALLKLATENRCDELFYNREYEPNERARDARVAQTFDGAGLGVRAFTDQCVIEPGELCTGEGSFYKVYSPFKRAWYKAWNEDPTITDPLPAPKKQPEMVGEPDNVPESLTGFDSPTHLSDRWPAGEKAARRRLDAFISSHLENYKANRDLPALDATSTISTYLASGVLSGRQGLAAAISANGGRIDAGADGAVHWVSELLWREFYRHILIGFPRVGRHRAFQPDTENITWHDNPEHFQAWCRGRTGFPIVDAAMRQLNQTGWMHNRLRMISAMFLTKNLFLDWRLGERYFMRRLIDGDLASNNGGWQWSASTGTDAAPYFRVFNPISQSQKCDPGGDFIRKYVPELEGLDAKHIHEPSGIPALLRSQLDYPEPIVDHKTTRAQAIAAFKALRG